MDDQQKLALGEILVLERILAPEQLEEILDAQRTQSKALGQICVERGFISQYGLKLVLKKYHLRMRLGEVLLTMGLISLQQLEQVLNWKGGPKKRLGEGLIELGVLSEEDLVHALSEQLDIPRVIPDLNLIDVNLVNGVSHRFLSAHLVLPAFKNSKGAITVIMSDPLNEETLRDLQSFFKCPILPAIATKTEITDTLNNIREKTTIEHLTQRADLEFIIQKDLMIEEGVLANYEDRTVAVIDFLISRAAHDRASDIHIEPQADRVRVRYRIDGVMQTKTDLPKDLGPSMVSRIKALCGLNITEKRRHQDGRIEAKIQGRDYDLRIATYPSLYGENVVIRLLQRQTFLVSLEQLGFSPTTLLQYGKLLNLPDSVILVTGPTGSGKSTTLYASLTYLTNRGVSIITVEDPIEYTIDGVVQGNYNPKLGLAHKDYIKAMMRQDPDVIMIGEIRDSETAHTAIQVSLTGHKVFSTFHAEDSIGALLRLLDMGIEPYLVASTVGAVLSQRLIRIICRHCREEARPGPELLGGFFVTPSEVSSHTFYKGRGCQKCHQTGFEGRTGIHELLFVNEHVREAILQRRTVSEIRQIARSHARLISLREDGLYKAIKGVTSLEEVNRVVFQREEDEQNHRSLGEILELCDKVGTTTNGLTPVAGISAEEDTLPAPLILVTINCNDPEKNQDEIIRLHEAHQHVAPEHQQLDFNDFARKLVENIRSNGHKKHLELVSISIRYKGGEARIYMEQPSAEPMEITPRMT